MPQPSDAYGSPLIDVGRRGKYLLLHFEPVTFAVAPHAGWPPARSTTSSRPSRATARPGSCSPRAPALLLTEAGKERRAGVGRSTPRRGGRDGRRSNRLGARRRWSSRPRRWPRRSRPTTMRLHGFLRDQHLIAGLGRLLANEVCHRAKLLAVRQHPQARRRRGGHGRRGASTPASRRASPTSAPVPDHVVVGRSAGGRARSGRRGLPGVRRHRSARVKLLRATRWPTSPRPARPAARCWPTTRRASS